MSVMLTNVPGWPVWGRAWAARPASLLVRLTARRLVVSPLVRGPWSGSVGSGSPRRGSHVRWSEGARLEIPGVGIRGLPAGLASQGAGSGSIVQGSRCWVGRSRLSAFGFRGAPSVLAGSGFADWSWLSAFWLRGSTDHGPRTCGLTKRVLADRDGSENLGVARLPLQKGGNLVGWPTFTLNRCFLDS